MILRVKRKATYMVEDVIVHENKRYKLFQTTTDQLFPNHCVEDVNEISDDDIVFDYYYIDNEPDYDDWSTEQEWDYPEELSSVNSIDDFYSSAFDDEESLSELQLAALEI